MENQGGYNRSQEGWQQHAQGALCATVSLFHDSHQTCMFISQAFHFM